MTEEVFRIVVAVAVGVACIMGIVQAFAMMAMFRVVKKLEQKVSPLAKRAEPVIENLTVVTSKIGPTMDSITPALQRVGPLVEKAEAAAEQLSKILASANRIVEDARPRISEVSNEVVAISHTGREQVERLGDLLQDAGERARHRLAQIDQTVEHTVENAEEVGDAVKRTVMRPVREMNGIAAGISAAVSTLVGKSRKYSVDSATQDEEMFI